MTPNAPELANLYAKPAGRIRERGIRRRMLSNGLDCTRGGYLTRRSALCFGKQARQLLAVAAELLFGRTQ